MELPNVTSLLQHRGQMLMIDGVLAIEPRKSCQVFKRVTDEDWFLVGHFPGNPIMPGSLQIEMYTQAAALPLLVDRDYRMNFSEQMPLILATLDHIRFYAPVYPGHKLIAHAEVTSLSPDSARAHVKGLVNSSKVSECKMTYKLNFTR